MQRLLMVTAILALVAGACGGDAEFAVADAWSRPAAGPNGAVYLTIDGGAGDVSLTGASATREVAAGVELHQTVLRADGTMGMTRMSEVEIPADSTVMMVPGGLHVMLIDLAKPLELGETFNVTLTFDDGTELIASVEVREE